MPKYRDAPRSEIDSQRALLDSLMGINRNNDREEDEVTDFRDDRVCKFFLVGMCPNDIFVNTKMDEGRCQKIHSEILKTDFEKSKDPYMYDSLIEREFNHRIGEADRVIKRARARVEEEKTDENINPDINPNILRIHAEMSRAISSAEAAGESGNIDLVQELVFGRLEELQREKAAVMSRITELKRQKPGGPDKKLRVCDVCGSFLSIFDSDKRLTDHFLGKQHIGYQYMRDSVEAIRKRREERRTIGGGSSANLSEEDRGSGYDNNNRGSTTAAGGGSSNGYRNNNREYDYDRDNNRYSGSSGGGGNRDYYRSGSRDRNYHSNSSWDRRGGGSSSGEGRNRNNSRDRRGGGNSDYHHRSSSGGGNSRRDSSRDRGGGGYGNNNDNRW